MSDYQTLLSNFEALGLSDMREYYPVLLDKVHTGDMSLTHEFLEITDKEMTFQKEKKMERAIHRARFPKVKTFDTFDFNFQPSLNRTAVLELKHLGFMAHKENIVFIGNPGAVNPTWRSPWESKPAGRRNAHCSSTAMNC